MPSLDFALKDFYRKKKQTYPYLIVIIMVIAITEFLIYSTSSLGLNLFTHTQYSNEFYFLGSIDQVYKQFNSLIQILLIILAVFVVVAITTTLIIQKKKDIGTMKALGTLPRKLYSFYLLEVFIIFLIGFLIGVIIGLISFGIFALVMDSLYFSVEFKIDLVFTPILFVSCFLGIFFITGFTLRRIGNQEIIKSFSKDIPYDYDASKRVQFIPKWLSSFGLNMKIAVTNTLRRKREFHRYFIVFSLISVILITLGLGTLVLKSSSEEWIHKSQGNNIVIIGHENVIQNYNMMYEMFSNPRIMIKQDDINFSNPNYLFSIDNVSNMKEEIEEIEQIDERLINFCDVKELSKVVIIDGEYVIIGDHRTGNFPVVGVNFSKIIQDFEIEGNYSILEDEIMIGDGLAYNLFERALAQNLRLENIPSQDGPHEFEISGIVIDSFYNGFAAYVNLDVFQEKLLISNETVNLLLLKLKNGQYNNIKNELESYIEANLGSNFTHINLDGVFEKNLTFLSNLSLYPIFIIIIITILGILSLYNYQKSGIIEKSRDFLIMRAIGSKHRSLKKILFIESIFVVIPSLLLSLGIAMILNSIILFARVSLPPLYIPFILLCIFLGVFIMFSYLSIVPIMRKIKKFSIKDYEIY
jgi:ABC-type antimicrobial peptide transport system permease subunit